MAITPEQRKQFIIMQNQKAQQGLAGDSTLGEVDPASLDSQFESLRAVRAPQVAPVSTPAVKPLSVSDTPPVKKQSLLNKMGSAIISSEKNFADTIGTALASRSKTYKQALEAKMAAEEGANKLALQIRKMEKAGKDVTQQKLAYQNLTGKDLDAGIGATEDMSATSMLGSSAGKNAKQILGEGLGVGVDVIGAGTLGKVKPAVGLLKGAKQGAKIGAAWGATSGLSEGMQANMDAKGIAKSTLKGATTGAVLGGVVGGGFGKLADKKANKVYKALDLTNEELGKVQKNKLKYLSKQGMEMTDTKGGILTKERYQMTDQVKKLSEEFRDVLVGKNAKENLKLAQQAGKQLDNSSDEIVKSYNKIVNEKTLRNKLTKAIEGIKGDSTFATLNKSQKQALSDAAIDDFMSYVKKGDLDGINQARKMWGANSRGADKTFSKANQVMHKAIQNVIEESLPDSARSIYKTNKVKMAKLFDVREILRAKKAARIGKSQLATTAKQIGGATAVAGTLGATGYGIKKLID